jgi:S-adenosylmethionine uptake transporter
MQVRHLGQLGEPEYRVVFYFSLSCLGAGFLGQLFGSSLIEDQVTIWHAHSGAGILLLLALGISATAAQVAMTRAYRLGKMLINANLQYAGIVFSSIWGALLWGDMLDWLGWLGIAIIIVSGSAATYFSARTARPLSVQPGKRTADAATTETEETPCPIQR